MPSQPSRLAAGASSPASTALQRRPSSQQADGALHIRPLSLVPAYSTREDDNDNFVAPTAPLLSSAQITFSVAVGQRSRTNENSSNSDTTVISAPLSQLYHSQLSVHVQCPNVGVYRASYAIDDLPIHQDVVLSIPLQRKQDALAVRTTSSSAAAPATSAPCTQNKIALRVHLRLEGPCRSEMVKAHQALGAWLVLVDRVEDVMKEVWKKASPQIPQAAKKKETLLLVIPAIMGLMVPLVTACVVLSPLAIGFCLLFFPIMIPLVVGLSLAVLATVLGTALIMTTIYASSRYGRRQLSHWWQSQRTLQDYWNIARGPRFGLQTFYYATGPRPTPVTLTRTQMPKEKWRRLGVSLTIDGVGSFSYLLPFIGEAFDIVWAPAQTVLIMALYQHVSPNMSYVSFAEELLPFMDVLPSATTGWLMEFGPELLDEAKAVVRNPSGTTSQLQLLLWGSTPSSTTATSAGGRTTAGIRRSLSNVRPSRNA